MAVLTSQLDRETEEFTRRREQMEELIAEVLLHREREVRAALHGRVVGDDHALAPLDDADSRHDACARRFAVVHLPGGERVQLEEGGAGIDEPVDPLPRRQLAA